MTNLSQAPVSASQTADASIDSIPCACGCGQLLTPRDLRQRFIAGHRHAGYPTHQCPSCGGIHRKKVNHV